MPNTNLNTLTVANTVIPLDEHERISLNALHNASGAAKHKAPNRWLENQSVKELIQELESQGQNSDLGVKVVSKVHGGTNRGTFAHQLLAISYAGWISPAFQLQVNQVFLDTKRFKAPAPERISVDKQGYYQLLHENINHDGQYQALQQKYIEALELNISQLLKTTKPTKAKRANIPLTHDEQRNILSLRKKGLGFGEIAKQVKRSRSAVRNVVLQHGGK